MRIISNLLNLNNFKDWDEAFNEKKILQVENLCNINCDEIKKTSDIIYLIINNAFNFRFKCWYCFPEDFKKIFPNRIPIHSPQIIILGDISYFVAIQEFVYNKETIKLSLKKENSVVSFDNLSYYLQRRILEYPISSVWLNLDDEYDLNTILKI